MAQPPSYHAYLDYEAPQPPVTASHYLLVVERQKWRILAFVATCLLVTLLVSSRLTPIYEATARIDVDRRVPAEVIGQGSSPSATADDADQFMATQMELIQSDAVLRPVALRFHLLEREAQFNQLQPDQVRRKANAPMYLKYLNVARPVNTYIIRISYRSPDPKLASDVANAIANSFLEHTFDIRVRSSSALSEFMERQLDELKAKMERSNLALAKFERELNIINPEEKTNILSARLLQLNTEYTNAQADRVRKEAASHEMQSGSMAAAQVSNQGEDLAKVYGNLNAAKQHFADVSTIYGANHSEYKKAANNLAEVERQFAEMRKNISERIDTDYREALNREKMLAKAVSETKAEYDSLNSHSFEYQQLKREADADKALYADLERRIREAGINAGFQTNSVRIADLARPPDKPVFPQKGFNLLLAFIISSVLAICGAVLADVLDNTLRDPEQASVALDIAVLGTLPTVKSMRRLIGSESPESDVPLIKSNETGSAENNRGLVPYHTGGGTSRSRNTKLPRTSPKGVGYSSAGSISSYEEAIRALRHAILLPNLDRSVKSLLLTSATPGEGKSTATLHLAIAHAEQSKPTLIIDADLRRPIIHKKLGLSGSTGLSDVLLGEMTWREALLKTDHLGLHVLPAGTASRRASDLVGSILIDILEEASKEYDLILVDAPPLLGFAEAMQVANAVDGVVVLARAGQTSRKAVARALATLARLRANVIGLVLNEVDKSNTHGYYDYNEYRNYYA